MSLRQEIKFCKTSNIANNMQQAFSQNQAIFEYKFILIVLNKIGFKTYVNDPNAKSNSNRINNFKSRIRIKTILYKLLL